MEYTNDLDIDAHTFYPANYKDDLMLEGDKTINGNHSRPKVNDDLTPYVDAYISDTIVKNDLLVIDGQIVMDNSKTEKEGPTPVISNIPIPPDIDEDTLYKRDVEIPMEKANDEYESEGKVSYECELAIGSEDESPVEFDLAEINEVIVHTPVVCDAKISDKKAYNQMLAPDKSVASLVLGVDFSVYLPTKGKHRSIIGYKTRDYMNGQDKIHTFPLVNGAHPYYSNIGVVKLGYCLRFRLDTIGNMYDANDSIHIKPRFYYIDRTGNNRQEADLYYSETFGKKRNYMIKVGSEQDQCNVKCFQLGNQYWQVPESELADQARINGTTLNDTKNTKSKLFTFDDIHIVSTLRTYIGGGSYTPTGTIPDIVDDDIAIRSV